MRKKECGDEKRQPYHQRPANQLDGKQHDNQTQNAAQHPHCPAVAGDFANGLRCRNIHQQRVVEYLCRPVPGLGQDEESHCHENIPLLHEEEQAGEHHRHGGKHKEKFLFCLREICNCPQDGREHGHDHGRDHHGVVPQGRAGEFRVGGHHLDKILGKYCQQDHRRVSRVAKVVQVPGPALAPVFLFIDDDDLTDGHFYLEKWNFRIVPTDAEKSVIIL